MSSESTIETTTKKQNRRAEEAEAENRDDEDEDDGEGNGAPSGRGVSAVEVRPREKVALERPSSLSMISTIAGRELAAYFNSVITYFVIAGSMIGLGLFFYLYKGGFWQVDRVTMQRMFDSLPSVLCALVIPLFTMRTLSDEKRVGTIELLITMPVKDSEVILGKYIAAVAVVAVPLALVVLYPIFMFLWPWQLGELDWGAFWVGMTGLLFLSATGVAIGLMYSSFTENQILSFFLTTLTLSGLYFLGNLSTIESLQGGIGDALSFISLQSRFEPFARGLIDTRAIVYFVSIAAFCLTVAFYALERRKWT